MYALADSLQLEIRSLQKGRELLLARLIAGKLSVSDIEIRTRPFKSAEIPNRDKEELVNA